MLAAQLFARTIAGVGALTDQANALRLISVPLRHSPRRFSIQFGFKHRHCGRRSKSILISCNSYGGSSGGNSSYDHEERDDDYIEASLLISETIKHYHMHVNGFHEEKKWQPFHQMLPFSVQVKDPRADVNSIGDGFLRRFQTPTIFLKIYCDGDFVLPITVGEFAVEKLIDSLHEVENGVSPNQFQLVRSIVAKLGYSVKMVRITERVVSTYFARIYFHKPGGTDILSMDARPSDAINVATRCRAPIFVNKQIVLTDAIRIVYGMGRTGHAKSVYDVTLDSASDIPDLLSEELGLVRNMNTAVKEERYNDAAMWRDKLMKIRKSRHELM